MILWIVGFELKVHNKPFNFCSATLRPTITKREEEKTEKKEKEKAIELGWLGKKPKGNGIKDSLVRLPAFMP